MLSGENYGGDRVALDLRGLTAASWADGESLSLMRAVAALQLTAPVWFIQTADQDVENWPLVGDRPIFTQHVRLQFDWMFIASLKREAAQAIYPENSGLELGDPIVSLCAEASVRMDGQDMISHRDNPWLRSMLDDDERHQPRRRRAQPPLDPLTGCSDEMPY